MTVPAWPGQQGLGVGEPPDGGGLAGRLDEPAHGLDLRAHRPGREDAGPQLGGGGPADRPGLRGAVAVLDRRHVGEQQQRVRVQLAGQQRGGQVLVHHRLHAAAARPSLATTGTPPPPAQTTMAPVPSRVRMAGRSSSSAGSGEGTTRRQRAPSWRISQCVARGQGPGLLLVVDRADELGRVREGRVVPADQGPADQAGHLAAGQRVLQRLDQPVADHALGLRAEHVERVGPGEGRVVRALQRQHARPGGRCRG